MSERESQTVRDLMPQTPESIKVNTGEQGLLIDHWDQFTDDIVHYLGLTESGRRAFANIKFFAFRLPNDRERPVEDEAYFLVIDDLPVASLSAIRDIGNFVQGLYANYLTPEWEAKVRRRIHNSSSEKIIYLDDPKKPF